VLGVRIKVRVKVQGNQQGGVTSSPLPSNLNSGVRAILGTIILERVRVRAIFLHVQLNAHAVVALAVQLVFCLVFPLCRGLFPCVLTGLTWVRLLLSSLVNPSGTHIGEVLILVFPLHLCGSGLKKPAQDNVVSILLDLVSYA